MSNSFVLAEKIKELEKIEHYFTEPNMDLEEGINKHKEALALSKEIIEYLNKVENTLNTIDISQTLG